MQHSTTKKSNNGKITVILDVYKRQGVLWIAIGEGKVYFVY